MGERFTKLYSLPERLYTKGAPVVIAAGALLKDNQAGSILVQLKIQNICNKKVKAVTVKIKSLDTVGRELGEDIEYQYLDLDAARNEYFGQQVPISVPNDQTRSYSVVVTEVAFDDNSIWAENGIWEPLGEQEPVDKKFQNSGLVEQYQLKYGKEGKYLLLKDKDLWMCACGTINHNEEEKCCSCRTTLANLEDFRLDVLRKEYEDRKEEEYQQRERERAQAEEEAKCKQQAKRKKITWIVTVVVVLAVAVVAGNIINSNLKNKRSYEEAVALMEEGNYSESIELFASLDSYKDSKDQINNVKYQQAEDCVESKEYEEAIAIYEELGDEDQVNKVKYQQAEDYVESKEYEEAIAVYEELGDYADSQEKCQVIEKKLYPAKVLCDYIREKGTSGDFEVKGIAWNDTGSCVEITFPNNPACVEHLYTVDANDEEVWFDVVLEIEHESSYMYLTLHLMYTDNEPKMEYTYYYEAKELWDTGDEKYDGRITWSGEGSIEEYQLGQELTFDTMKSEMFNSSTKTWQENSLDTVATAATVNSSIGVAVQQLQIYLEENTEITMADLGFDLEETE